ncbi:MAG: V-type ATP synthase subunit D, partial [Lentisphaerota bacterium]
LKNDRQAQLGYGKTPICKQGRTIRRISNELRRTQRRCNALSKIFIPTLRKQINYILSALEERERESLITLKIIRANLKNKHSHPTG